jgi:hypothetical protein
MSESRSGRRSGALQRLEGWLVLALGLCSVTSGAHDFSQSESLVEVSARTVRARIRVNLLEIAGVDANLDQRVSYEELDRAIERVYAAIADHYLLRAPAAPDRTVAERYEIGDDHVLQLVVAQTFGSEVREVQVTSRFDALFGPAHQHLVTVMVNGVPERAVLDASNRTATFDLGVLNRQTILATAAAVVGLAVLALYRSRSRRGERQRAAPSSKGAPSAK